MTNRIAPAGLAAAGTVRPRYADPDLQAVLAEALAALGHAPTPRDPAPIRGRALSVCHAGRMLRMDLRPRHARAATARPDHDPRRSGIA